MGTDHERSVQLPSGGARQWAAFQAGRFFNELCWSIDQAVLLGDRRIVATVTKILKEIVPKVIEAFPYDSGSKIEGVLRKNLKDWERMTASEEFADEWSGARDAFESGLEPSLEVAFQGMLQMSGAFKQDVRIAIEGEFEASSELKYAFLLGKCVDQGIRPQGVTDYVHRWEMNPEWWIWRRSPAYRRALKKYQRDRAALLRGNSRRLSLGREQIRLKRPNLPEKEISTLRVCPAESIPPPIGWAETVKALWTRLQLSADLPKSLPAITRRPGSPGIFRVIELINQAAKVGFLRPAFSSTTSRFPHSDQPAFVGYPMLGCGQRTPLTIASDSFTATGNRKGDQGISKVDTRLENPQEPPVYLDNNQMLSEDTSVEPHSMKRVSKKRSYITKDEAETLIKECIKRHGTPSIRKV